MWRSNNYAKILVLTVLVMVLYSCKHDQKTASPSVIAVQVIEDTVLPQIELSPQEITDGLHLRLQERLSLAVFNDSLFTDFYQKLRFNKGPVTLLLPKRGLVSCEDCRSWDDLLLAGSYDSPLLSSELNGLRIEFSVPSVDGKQWNFTRKGDSLLVTDFAGQPYLLWQTDVRAANGLLHILKPIDSLSD